MGEFRNNRHAEMVKCISTSLPCSHDVSCRPNVAQILQPAAHKLIINHQRLVGLQFLQSFGTFVMKNIIVDVGVQRVGQVLRIVCIIYFSHLYWLIPSTAAVFLRKRFKLDIKCFRVLFFFPFAFYCGLGVFL